MGYDTAVLVGSGGMGEVYKAWDPELERWVALKYLRSSDPELVERLFREARAQARVDHPCVGSVYDVGEDEGRPYIAMEYVDGRLLDRAAADLALEQKVLLIRQVAEAVHAAHAVGLIHRDLKPGNIIVTETSGGELKPYVLDFGIARSQEVEGLTITGQVLGTPGYLSPEQACGETRTLDRRTDVFSLGVILYELLGGAPPFDGDSSVEVLVNLLEREPRPLRRIAPSVPRDLETVVATCLEKDPERRYPSARALAEDLGRFLDGEPVAARPIGALQRLRRTARKHKVATTLVGAFALAAVVLLAALIGGWVKYTVDLKRQRDVAEQKVREAREVTDFLIGVFKSSDPRRAQGEQITAAEILDRGAQRIGSDFESRPDSQGRLMAVIGLVYHRLGLHDRAAGLLEQAVETLDSQPGTDAGALVDAQLRLGEVYMDLGRYELATDTFNGALSNAEVHLGAEHHLTAFVLGGLGRALSQQGHYVESRELLERALGIEERVLGPDDPEVGSTLNDLGVALHNIGDLDAAESAYRRALAIREQHLAADDPRVATTLSNLGNTLQSLDRNDEAGEVLERALAIREEVLGGDHPRVATTLNNLSTVHMRAGNFERAEELLLRGLAIRESALGPDHPRMATIHDNLGFAYHHLGDQGRAEKEYQRALEITAAGRGDDHPLVAVHLTHLAELYRSSGRDEEALQIAERALGVAESSLGAEHYRVAVVLQLQAALHLDAGRLGAAQKAIERALEIASTTLDEEHRVAVRVRETHAEVLRAAGGRGH